MSLRISAVGSCLKIPFINYLHRRESHEYILSIYSVSRRLLRQISG